MGGFAAGLSQGLEVARDRQMQAQSLQLQQDMAKAQQKQMQTQDQMMQLNMQALMRKIEAQTKLPGMQQQGFNQAPPPESGSIGTLKGLLGDQPNEPFVSNEPAPEPQIDRAKLTSFLQTAAQAGQDPQQLLQLMSISDPRIKAIADSLLPPAHEKLGEGETIIDKRTGKTVAEGKPKHDKPVSVPPGGTLVKPDTGEQIYQAPAAPPKPIDVGDRTESLAMQRSQEVYGVAMRFEDLLKKDPILAAKVRDKAMNEEQVNIAGAKQGQSINIQQKELLTPEEANKLAVPYGTTKEQAKGILPLTAQQRESVAAFDSARIIIDDIDQYSKKVNTAGGGLAGRLEQGSRLWGAYTQSDPDAALLQSKAGELARLARSMGEKGAMAEGDIARSAALVPGITDTKEVAMQKIKDLKALIDNGEQAFRNSVGMKPRSANSGTKAPPIKQEDPTTANIPVPPNLSPKQQEIFKQEYLKQRQKVQGEMQKGQTNAQKPK